MSTIIDLKETANMLRAEDCFTLICHASPDGDTLGSAFALCGALQKMQKKVKIVFPDAPSNRFDYMRKGITPHDFEEHFIISLDVADEKLLGCMEEVYSGRIDLSIDHHVSNTGYAKYLLLDSEAAAAAEVVFVLIKELDEGLMDENIAACLYTGVSTDTGCFRFSNTTALTHRIVADLMDYGFDCAGLNYLIFDMRTKERIELEKHALDSIEYHFGGKCAIITLTQEILSSSDDEDVNGVSALPRQINGVELGVTLKEKENDIWKISLRSKDYINSQEICTRFGGGGHVRAAGCRMTGSITECKEKLLNIIAEYI